MKDFFLLSIDYETILNSSNITAIMEFSKLNKVAN